MKIKGRIGKQSLSDHSDSQGLVAASRVLSAGGRVPKRFAAAIETARRPASAGPTLQAKSAQAKISPARREAFVILTLMGQSNRHSDDLLRGPGMHDLSAADQHLATALVMGVLRWQIALDARIRTLLERPGQRLPESLAIVLRMGAFQLLHMDRIPAHAALSESVELCRAAEQPHASGMVNAVLRKLATAPKPGEKVFEFTAVFAQRLGHPAWLVERWVSAYGREAALAICAADQVEPGRNRLFSPDETLPLMDDGSRLVAEIAAAAVPATQGRPPCLWDCCAAPGGKTLVLAARTPLGQLLATDVSTRRTRQMDGRLRNFPYASNVATAVADAANLESRYGEFDLILCDVPCSGTGTLGRNPEIRLRLRPEELTRQSDRQKAILSASLKRLAPGGRLVYSTCSLEPEENQAVIEAVAGGVRRVPIEQVLIRVPGLTHLRAGAVHDGLLRTLPGVDGCDGFFAVVLER